MNNMPDIQRKVDEAFASIENIERAQPKPFFFTRLEARMSPSQFSIWERISHAVTRPAVALATLSLVLILNAAVVIQGISAVDNVPDFSEMASTEDLRASTSFYEIENNLP
jgi:hypothetical protein